jgi:VanZ family protein
MKKWLIILVAVLMCGLIFYFTQSSSFTTANTIREFAGITGMSNDEVLLMNLIIRKAMHLFLFALLAILLKINFYNFKGSYLIAWLGATLYGLGDEFHQSLVPERESSIFDVMIDSTGACLGLIVFYLINRIRKYRKV